MDKVIVRVAYNEYIVSAKDALELARILNSAEHYQTKGYGEERTYYVYPQDRPVIAGVEFITPELYRMAKLAGKPEND